MWPLGGKEPKPVPVPLSYHEHPRSIPSGNQICREPQRVTTDRLEGDDRPKDQQEKNDQWMIRFSKAVDRNLGPFFRAWNIPVTERALAEVGVLPEWEEDPMGKYRD